MSNPKLTFDKTAWIGSSLRAREDTNAWAGAYLLFGAPWNMDKTQSFGDLQYFGDTSAAEVDVEMIVEKPKLAGIFAGQKSYAAAVASGTDSDTTPTTEVKATVDDNNLDAVAEKNKCPPKKVAFQIRNYFLSKSIPTPKAKPKFLSKAQERKFSTFFKVRLPKMQSKDLGELESEVVASFQILAGLLWGIDSQLLIYPWVDSTANRPLKKGGQTPKHHDGLKVYADNIYLEQYKSPWLKLRIGHTTDEESFAEEEFKAALMRSDMNFYKEKLQTKFTCRTGWLLGTHNMAFNARNLEAAIEQLSEFKEIPIEVWMEPVRTKRGSAKKTSKANDKIAAFVRAAHVWTSWEKSAACRKALSC